jgi:hypothetical protein
MRCTGLFFTHTVLLARSGSQRLTMAHMPSSSRVVQSAYPHWSRLLGPRLDHPTVLDLLERYPSLAKLAVAQKLLVRPGPNCRLLRRDAVAEPMLLPYVRTRVSRQVVQAIASCAVSTK